MSHQQSADWRGRARSGRLVRATLMGSVVLTVSLIVWTSALPWAGAQGGEPSALVARALVMGIIGLVSAAVMGFLVRPAEVPER